MDSHDELTGLLSRRAWLPILEAAVEEARLAGTSVAVLLGDVDRIFLFNANHGHLAGDLWLRECGRIIQRAAGSERPACRFGGDEFLILMPRATPQSALDLAEWTRFLVGRSAVEDGAQVLAPLTMSFGVALFPQHGADAEALLRAADTALNDNAKVARNCVRMAVTA